MENQKTRIREVQKEGLHAFRYYSRQAVAHVLNCLDVLLSTEIEYNWFCKTVPKELHPVLSVTVNRSRIAAKERANEVASRNEFRELNPLLCLDIYCGR